MKQRITHFISALVLVVFSLYLVPHELVHVLYDHHDTEHADTPEGNSQSLSVIHIHCDFLSTYLGDFLPGDQPVKTECAVDLPVNYANVAVQTVRCIAILRDSRGPPVS